MIKIISVLPKSQDLDRFKNIHFLIFFTFHFYKKFGWNVWDRLWMRKLNTFFLPFCSDWMNFVALEFTTKREEWVCWLSHSAHRKTLSKTIITTKHCWQNCPIGQILSCRKSDCETWTELYIFSSHDLCNTGSPWSNAVFGEKKVLCVSRYYNTDFEMHHFKESQPYIHLLSLSI